MKTQPILRGFTTINYWADDMYSAKRWYCEFLGIEPYFERSDKDGRTVYIEFRLGDYMHELGLIDRRFAPPNATIGPGGAIMYWHVDDVEASLNHLLSLGAKIYEPVIQRGEGFITASVIDPFGNIIGIMYNSHYLKVLRSQNREESELR